MSVLKFILCVSCLYSISKLKQKFTNFIAYILSQTIEIFWLESFESGDSVLVVMGRASTHCGGLSRMVRTLHRCLNVGP